MRVANLRGRLVVLTGRQEAVGVEQDSQGLFASAPQAVFDRWQEFRTRATTVLHTDGEVFVTRTSGHPSLVLGTSSRSG